MKHVALVYYSEDTMKTLDAEQWDAINRECIACGEQLQTQS